MFRILPLLLLSCVAHASTITLTSSALNTQNQSNSPTINISPHPAWTPSFAGSNWISIAITGDPRDPGYVVLPNGTTVSFFQQFSIDGVADAANLSVLADDTTSVILNGHVMAMPFTTGGPVCAAQPIGCLTITRGDFTSAQLLPFIHSGVNTIQFDVLQHDLVSFGLDYSGSVSNDPEPGTAWLVAGAGVLMWIVIRKRRTRSV